MIKEVNESFELQGYNGIIVYLCQELVLGSWTEERETDYVTMNPEERSS